MRIKTVRVIRDYTILELNDDGALVGDDDDEIHVQQYTGEKLDCWKAREDGFYFVFCNRLEIGYWVHPDLVEVEDKTNETN